MTEPEPRSRVGSQIGPYRLRRLLGKGGMGEVYEAEDTVRERVVALKLLPEAVSHDPVFRTRLQREAHAAGRLQEPHVVPIHDYGEIDGLLFVDMRLIDGTDLRTILRERGPMDPARATAVVRQIASALDSAHRAGILHRDVKPENILLDHDDFAYLVDFGIANAATDETLTQLGTAVGTYAYMAPERFGGGEVDHRADVYALTCVLYECLTGVPPFRGDSVSAVIAAHLNNPPPRPSAQRPGLPAGLDEVVARGLAKRPQDRYPSAGEMARAAADAVAVTWPPMPPGRESKGPMVAFLAAGAVIVLTLAGLGIWLMVRSGDSTEATDASDSMAARTDGAVPTSPEPSRRTRTATTPALPSDSADEQLMSLLSGGHDSSNCQPVQPPAAGAVATVDCTQALTPSGPAFARYSIFADRNALDAAFNEAVQVNSELMQCPGSGIDSPTTWHYVDSPDQVVGQIACGTYNDNADVVWTNDEYLLLVDAQGSDLAELHNWWLQYG
ncbi:serine/threonine-protein kinase [Mycobacterium sp. ITM-2016-00317]|uniref:serine/threonine-protein kinase n=1 Tax=Mycobacterium sp. ITM-2016-00317 TaxID=2099694 RepID=UPI00287F7DAA|nr:serine/threonine-protein kinase [Mycobacterium sp. ITM-2016-00317]WNG86439.1 serine/threonine-protein kinase [Mycobacterium sp. ITM-2016-00317]